MSFGKLHSALTNSNKQKIIPALVTDVLGAKCAVQLAGSGSRLTGLLYVGSIPKVGDSVLVDYRNTNTPVVITSTIKVVTTAPVITASSTPSASTGTTAIDISTTDYVQYPEADGVYYVMKDGEWVEIPDTGVGASALSGLTDVTIASTPSDLQVLQYDSTFGKWIPATLIDSSGHTIAQSGTAFPSREKLNFIGATVSDDSGTNSTNVTIPSSAHVIQDNGTAKTQRENLNIIGMTITDDSTNNATIVTLPDTKHIIQENGTSKASRAKINIIGASVSDNPSNNSTDVTISLTASNLEVKETDGTPDVYNVSQLIFPNGSLINNGSGSLTVDSTAFSSPVPSGTKIYMNTNFR